MLLINKVIQRWPQPSHGGTGKPGQVRPNGNRLVERNREKLRGTRLPREDVNLLLLIVLLITIHGERRPVLVVLDDPRSVRVDERYRSFSKGFAARVTHWRCGPEKNCQQRELREAPGRRPKSMTLDWW